MTDPLPAPVRVLERAVHTAPFGVRFRDPLGGGFVGDGLRVVAWPEDQPSLRREAAVNRAAVWTLHDLPGLRSMEFLDVEDPGAWSAPRVTFVIQVSDSLGRFLPLRCRARLPERGLWQHDCALSGGSLGLLPPPGAPSPSVTLYSAPARGAAATFAAVRADLWDPIRRAPASWAVVEVRVGDAPPVLAMADRDGRMAAWCAYPQPVDLPPGSVSHAFPLSPPLTAQSWPVRLVAHYVPQSPAPDAPELCAALQQAPARLWADAARTVPLFDQEIHFGRELVVRTSDGGVPLSRLHVTPA